MPQPRSTATPGSTLRAAQSGGCAGDRATSCAARRARCVLYVVLAEVAQATAQHPVLHAVPGVCVLYVVLSTDECTH
jgi:hypothetical protein